MSRNVFPFEADREVIRKFLEGVKDWSSPAPTSVHHDGSGLHVRNGWLMISDVDSDGRWTAAYYDTADALTVTVDTESDLWACVRIFNFILEALGDTRRIEKEVTRVEGQLPGHRFFLDGEEVHVGAPFVLAGAMTIQAYRAKERE